MTYRLRKKRNMEEGKRKRTTSRGRGDGEEERQTGLERGRGGGQRQGGESHLLNPKPSL